MGWTQLDSVARAAPAGDNNSLTPSQISFFEILPPNQGNTLGPSANRSPSGADRGQTSHFQEGLRSWGALNLTAGGVVGLSTYLRTNSEAAVGKAFLNGFGVNALTSTANLALDSLVPSVGGHRLFKTTEGEAMGIGLTAGLPISDLRIKAGLIGVAWLSGRVCDYFDK